MGSVNRTALLSEEDPSDWQNHILLVGQDIDHIAGLMCYIQLSVLGVPGFVKIGDTLADPIHWGDDLTNYWFTPGFAALNRTRRTQHKFCTILFIPGFNSHCCRLPPGFYNTSEWLDSSTLWPLLFRSWSPLGVLPGTALLWLLLLCCLWVGLHLPTRLLSLVPHKEYPCWLLLNEDAEPAFFHFFYFSGLGYQCGVRSHRWDR